MTGWLAVVSAEHVSRGVAGGFAQTNHGARAGLDRMQPGDWLVYYSPREGMREGAPVQSFTAIGQVEDSPPWQEDLGDWRPWRRRVAYLAGARRLPIAQVRHELDLCAGSNWGYQLRRGQLPLSRADLHVIHAGMAGLPLPVPGAGGRG